MDREKKPGLQAQAAQARARAAELDRQAREIEQSAVPRDWRHRARVREAASRLRLRAGSYLVKALQIEDSIELKDSGVEERERSSCRSVKK
jgi:hypothetical protein